MNSLVSTLMSFGMRLNLADSTSLLVDFNSLYSMIKVMETAPISRFIFGCKLYERLKTSYLYYT